MRKTSTAILYCLFVSIIKIITQQRLMVYNLLIIFLLSFLGYLLGRFGHVYLNVWLRNPKFAPHHWIYGIILIFLGLEYSEILFASFGFGLFLSDLKDFLKLKFIGPDEDDKKKFWDID